MSTTRRTWEALDLGPWWTVRASASETTARSDFDAQPETTARPAATVEPLCAPISVRPEWSALEEAALGCRRCGLCETRNKVVFGTGSREARWLIIGEAPGEQEDLQGEPFVGPAGRLLDQMLRAIALDRAQDVYITNVLKCRPPRNRDPASEEVAQCRPHLIAQMERLSPHIILTLGRFAATAVLGVDQPLGRLRGQVHLLEQGGLRIPVVATFHPAYLLRSPLEKARAWSDLRLARRTLAATAPTAG